MKKIFKLKLRKISFNRTSRLVVLACYVLTIFLGSFIFPEKANAAITFVNATTATIQTGTTITIDVPSGVQDGDIMIASIALSSGEPPLTSAGWTAINDTANDPVAIYSLWKRATGSEPANYVFSGTAGERTAGGIAAYRGAVASGSPINAVSTDGTGTNSTNVVSNSVTTTANGAVVIGVFGISFSAPSSFTPPTTSNAMTERFDVGCCTGTDDVTIELADFTKATAGASGTHTAVAANTATVWAAHSFAISPPIDIEQAAYRFLSNMAIAGSEVLVYNPSANDDSVKDMVIDKANGFFYVGGHTNTEWEIEKRNLNDGSLVAAFAYPTGVTGTLEGLALDPTGSYIYTAGVTSGTWRIEKRRTSDAALCTAANCGTAFDTDGIINSGTGFPSSGAANDIEIDGTNGVIYVAGYETVTDDQWLIGAYNSTTGAVVSGFSQNGGGGCSLDAGYYCNDPGATGSDRIMSIKVDPTNGHLYAGGFYVNANTDWRIEKMRTSDGALCTAGNCGTQFGTNGVYTETPTAGTDQILNLELDVADTALYVGGLDSTSANQWRLEKIRADTGVLCNGGGGCNGGAFDTDGIVTYDGNASGNDQLFDVDIDDTGGNFLYTKGQDTSTGTSNMSWRIEKRNRSNGALVTSFGSSGVININPSANNDIAGAIAVDVSRNLIYLAGGDRTLSSTNQQWRMQKFDLTGGAIWLAAQDTAAQVSRDITFRLRMVLHANGTQLNSGAIFDLQYAPKSGTCDTSFVGETYTDVTTSSSGVSFHDNPSLSDADAFTGVTGDPSHGHTTANQTYEEANSITSTANIPANQDGRWDFALKPSSDALGAYCFRMVDNSGDTPLTTYTVVPEIDFCQNAPGADIVMRGGNYFCSGTKRSFFWAL